MGSGVAPPALPPESEEKDAMRGVPFAKPCWGLAGAPAPNLGLHPKGAVFGPLRVLANEVEKGGQAARPISTG